MEKDESQSLSLKVWVVKEKNKVVFAESNKDFVNVLFSFMTLPVGAVIALTREQSSRGEIGCLNNLYASVECLEEEFLQSPERRDMMLHPRSAAEIYCRNLKLNLVESDCNEYYVCKSSDCNFVNYYQTAHCRCGKDLEIKLIVPSPNSIHQEEKGFVKPTARFMISDDFQVRPMSTMTGITLLTEIGALDGSPIEEKTVNIGRNEVLKLLKCSLTSRTPISDTFMEPHIGKPSYKILYGKYGPRSLDPLRKVTDTAMKETKICFTLIVNKSKNRTVYAEVKEDFVDLLCSFLTFPLGYVFEGFPCLSFKGCMGNLYKSIQDTEVNCFNSEEMKRTLVNPKLAPGLAYNYQLIGIEEALNPSYSTLSSHYMAKNHDLNLKSHGEVKTGEGFIKGPSMFMVTDNLMVTPLSPISGLSLIRKLQIPLSDIEEHQVTMGEDQAMRLLVASLVSKCALTDAFLLEERKQEQY